jgi:hypothetical protein
MAALPDGTYLILNGAHQGFGGFGLATSPNRNAVLYHPTKPFHQRFSVMVNTTVNQMYHSGAILLDDGRVLVSGSDAQDDVHAQEIPRRGFYPTLPGGQPGSTRRQLEQQGLELWSTHNHRFNSSTF